jgi:hypothetical protein
LDRDLKMKKQEIVDAELALKKLEHDVGLAAKEKAAAEALQENLTRQFPWISDEHQYVHPCSRALRELYRKASRTYSFQILWQSWIAI